METNDSHRELVCLLFPGQVKNEEKAIDCLGGIRNISNVYCQSNQKRLGLSFQPDNPYIRKIFGDMKKTSGVLLKAKVKKRKEGNEVKREVISTSVVGRVKTIFRFDSLCDFQYMPAHRVGNGPMQCYLDELMPSGLDDSDFITNCPPTIPPIIIPGNFTRTDKPITYAYTDKKPICGPAKIKDKEVNVHNRSRAERGLGLGLQKFKFNLIDDLPTEPHESYRKVIQSKVKSLPQLEADYETVKKLFEERPTWTTNLIRYRTKIRLGFLKFILPCLAVYFRHGPWTNLWVRYGYDPRKDPGARIYQTLDFRLRHQAGVHSMVMTRGQVANYKKADRVKHTFKRRMEHRVGEPNLNDIPEAAVIFRPGMTPAQRQIFYQYCDVKIPEVEAILAPEPPPGYLCHQTRGWLPPDTDNICRDHIFRYVKETLLANRSTDLKLEERSSDEDSDSNDDSDSSSDEPSNSNTDNTQYIAFYLTTRGCPGLSSRGYLVKYNLIPCLGYKRNTCAKFHLTKLIIIISLVNWSPLH